MCRHVLNFLPWFLVLCSYLLPPLWGSEEAHGSMTLPLATLVLELLEPLSWTVKTLVVFTSWVLHLPVEPRAWDTWPSCSVVTVCTSPPGFRPLDCPPSAHTGSTLGVFGDCLLGKQNSY